MAEERKKFLFDQDFDDIALLNEIARNERQARPSIMAIQEDENEEDDPDEEEVPTFSEEDVTAARQQGFNDGKEEGLKQALESNEKEIADALANIGQQLSQVFQIQEKTNSTISRDAASLSLAVGRKLFPKLNEEHGLGEITHMMESALDHIIQEPKITIYGNDKYVDQLSERIENSLTARGFQGEVRVIGDGSLAMGDCRIEWQNGEAVRDMSALLDELTQTIEQHTGVMERPAAVITESDVEIAENTGPAGVDQPEASVGQPETSVDQPEASVGQPEESEPT